MSDNQNGWVKDEDTGAWYYFYDDGSMAWDTMVNGYYVNADGQWTKDEGSRKITDNAGNDFWYYVGPKGKAVTGWNKIGDSFHYYNYPGGSMTYDNNIDGFNLDYYGNIASGTGWLKDGYSKDWYHYSDGQMTKGWEQEGNNWYYLNDDGKMATGWEKVGGNWYYFHSDGSMATGWVNDGNGWYYLYSNGSMAWGKTVDGYHLNSSGKMVTGTGWQYIDGSWYYLKDDGTVAINWKYINDNWYYLYPEGSMAWNTTVDGYYLNKDGEWVPNAVGNSNDEINSLPEYDPLSARLNENKGTRVKNKGVNGKYFAGTIDDLGGFAPDDLEGFTGIAINRDESSFIYKATNFGQGVIDVGKDTVVGLIDVAKHPIDTVVGLDRLMLDPNYAAKTAITIGTEIKGAYERDVTNGDANSKAYFTGRVVGEGVLLFGGEFTKIGKAGEVSKAEKAAETARIAEEAAKGSINSEISVQHAVGNANQAQSVLDGINPKYFNSSSRFGGGFYVGGDSDTIVAELAEHGNTAKYAISYDMDLSGQKVLDLTNPEVASEWNYVQNVTSTKECQGIGELAQSQGYTVVEFQSYRGSGINYVIYDNFKDILSAKMVTPVD